MTEGLYKLFHPAILDGRTWITWKRRKTSTGCLKHSIYDFKHSKYDPNTQFFFRLEPDDSKHSILPHLSRRLKKSWHALLENINLGQLKMREHQVKCGALLAQLWYRFIKEDELIRTIKWTLSDSELDKRRINVGICQQSTLCVPYKSNWADFHLWQFNSCWGFKVSKI